MLLLFVCFLRSSSLVMTELLHPWSCSLQDLFTDLKGSNPELSSVVMESIATAAQHGSATRMECNILPILSE